MTKNDSTRPILLTRREACGLLKIGLSTYKLLVGRGALREIRIGTRGRRLPYGEAVRYVRESLGGAEVEV
jgi:hypothetical protein